MAKFLKTVAERWKTWRLVSPTLPSGFIGTFPDLATRLRVVRRLPWAARLEAIRSGLSVASPDEAGPIAVELVEMAVTPAGGLFLERRRERADRALRAMVCLWERVPDSSRPLALSVGQGRLVPVIEDVLRDRSPGGGARGAALLACDIGSPEAGAALVESLRLEDEQVRAGAALGLLGLSLRARSCEAGQVEPEVQALELGSSGGDGAIGAVERACLDVHLADAAWGFAGHQRRLVLLAGLGALDLSGLSAARRDQSGSSGAARLLRLVQESSHVAHRALRQMLRFSPAPLVRARAMLLLAEPAIAEAALERVSRAEGALEHSIVLEMSHLGLRPARRRLLSMVRVTSVKGAAPAELDGPSVVAGREDAIVPQAGDAVDVAVGQVLPDRRTLAGLSTDARRGCVRLASLVDGDERARSAALHDLLGDSEAAVRLAACGAVPRAELSSYCLDSDVHVARSALLRWSGAGLGHRARMEGGERLRVAELLTRSPHAAVRRLGEQEVAREGVWDAASPASRAGAWRLALRDRDALLTKMRDTIREAVGQGSPERVERAIRSIAVARKLALTRVLSADLAGLIDPARGGGTGDPRLVATAASALGGVDDAGARDALRRALDHADERVRANAVESIGVQRLAVEDATTGRDRDYPRLIELKGDPHHRVRANAIRALLLSPPACPKERRPSRGAAARGGTWMEEKPRVYEPAAVEALGAMLTDGRAEHRLAGAWLAGRVLSGGRRRVGEAWSSLGSALTDLGRRDTSEAVRARASYASARLAAGVRASWGGMPPPTGGAIEDGSSGEAGVIGLAPMESARKAG